MEDQTNQSVGEPQIDVILPKPPAVKRNWWITTTVVFVLLFFMTLALILTQQANNRVVKVFNNAINKTPVSPAIANPTATWKVYTDPVYGYSFRYPSNWYLNHDIDTDLLLNDNQRVDNSHSKIEIALLGPFEEAEKMLAYSDAGAVFHLDEEHEEKINNIKMIKAVVSEEGGNPNFPTFPTKFKILIPLRDISIRIDSLLASQDVANRIAASFHYIPIPQNDDPKQWNSLTEKEDGFTIKYPPNLRARSFIDYAQTDPTNQTPHLSFTGFFNDGLFAMTISTEPNPRNLSVSEWLTGLVKADKDSCASCESLYAHPIQEIQVAGEKAAIQMKDLPGPSYGIYIPLLRDNILNVSITGINSQMVTPSARQEALKILNTIVFMQ